MASDDDFLRSFLISVLKEQVDALVETQDTASGLWHTLIDD
jgi:rhamnogalacturonyl hydrolase YesR